MHDRNGTQIQDGALLLIAGTYQYVRQEGDALILYPSEIILTQKIASESVFVEYLDTSNAAPDARAIERFGTWLAMIALGAGLFVTADDARSIFGMLIIFLSGAFLLRDKPTTRGERHGKRQKQSGSSLGQQAARNGETPAP